MALLNHIRVLDLSRVLAGPWCTQCLADFGAVVWKVEHPVRGDDTRAWGPPWHGAPGATRESAYYLCANRGKLSLGIDFSRPEGSELVRRLAARADVVVENFKVGGLAAYGLDWASLGALNPRLVYCSISAFGQDGPAAASPGYDAMIQAASGLMSITGESDGAPQKVGVAITDLLTGMYAVAAILAALHERDRSGQGQHIDLALFDTQIAALANQGMNYLVSGCAPRRLGTAHPSIVPYQAFATADGHIMVAVGNDRQFADLCVQLGEPDLARDERYATNAARVANREALVARVSELLARRPSREWLDAFTRAAIPCGPINSIAEAFAEPQAVHRKLRFDLRRSQGDTVPQVRNPALFSRSTLNLNLPPPMLGEHTDEVLASQLGLSTEEHAELRAKAVIR
ncbi:MAG TPA: CaiB/BaiF CoA-transferase family protein [Steroidobacteraceae bacterium]|nr:CaiB/BaiF CoA-transferase family protein [Steroidobacteraceae bacterium]